MVVEPVVEVTVEPPEVMMATRGEVVMAMAGTVVALAVLEDSPLAPPPTTAPLVTVAVEVLLTDEPSEAIAPVAMAPEDMAPEDMEPDIVAKAVPATNCISCVQPPSSVVTYQRRPIQ